MFFQSDPWAVTATLSGAGFSTVDVTSIAVVLNLGADPADAAGYLADAGIGRAVLDTVAESDKPAALDAVRSGRMRDTAPGEVTPEEYAGQAKLRDQSRGRTGDRPRRASSCSRWRRSAALLVRAEARRSASAASASRPARRSASARVAWNRW